MSQERNRRRVPALRESSDGPGGIRGDHPHQCLLSSVPLYWTVLARGMLRLRRDQHHQLESEHWTLSKESPNLDLEQLTEHMAEQIIFTIGAATDDPKAAVVRLLRTYLAEAQEQAYEEALYEQQLEERDQQN
jgi:hypothetical protein